MARNFITASNESIDHGDIDAMDSATTLTMSAWMKRSTANDFVSVTKFTTQANQIYLLFYSDGNFYSLVRNASTANYWYTALNDTLWHRCMIVFDGSLSGTARQKMYVDGVLDTGTYVGTPPTTTPAQTGNLVSGLWSGNFTNGDISNVNVWSTALSANDALMDYQGFIPQRENLIVDSPYGIASPEPDYSGNGHDGTITSTPTVSDNPPIVPHFGFDISTVPYEVASTGWGPLLAGQRNNLVLGGY